MCMRAALQDVEQSQPSPMVIFLLQRHADLLRDAARGRILGVNLGHEPLHAQLHKGVVATGPGGLGGQALAPVLAQQVPADVGLHAAIDRMADQAAVADGFVTALEGDGPESEAALGVAA